MERLNSRCIIFNKKDFFLGAAARNVSEGKVWPVAATMNQRDALYYLMTGETFNGRKAADMGLVMRRLMSIKKKDVKKACRSFLMKNRTVPGWKGIVGTTDKIRLRVMNGRF